MNKGLTWFLSFLCLVVTLNVAFAAETKPLAPEKAFKFSAKFSSKNKIILNWDIAPGTYLYAKRFKIQIQKPIEQTITNLTLPKNFEKIKTKTDEIEMIYKKQISFPVEIPQTKKQTENYQLLVQYQGCSESGYCYPPKKKILLINDRNIAITDTVPVATEPSWFEKQKQLLTEPDRIMQIFSQQSFVLLLFAFFVFGVLLSLTPCVLPMIPILSNIILGQSKTISAKKGFTLSLSYVLGMSITYALLGVIAALLGYSLQAAFQNPWVLSVFAAIFILLSLASFGVYELQPPERLRTFLSNRSSSKTKNPTIINAAMMGVVSSVVISPCVTAPFIGALAYISQSGNILVGSLALFILGIGMGVPLLVTGVAGGKLLPHAGAWMEKIKELFGILLLLVAVQLISRFSNSTVSNLLWASVCFIGAILFFNTKNLKRLLSQFFWRSLAILSLLAGIYFLLQINLVKEIIYPKKELALKQNITTVTNLNQLQTQLKKAKQLNQAVILDFYADWCAACKDMEHTTFNDPNIKSILKNFKMIRVDITANDFQSQQLMQRYQVIAPPVLIFLSSNGDEIPNKRIVGEIDTVSFKKFAQNVCNSKLVIACLE